MQKQGKEVDPVRVFAERVRDHKELDTRWAVLQEARVEYFRGKDFIALLRAHPELIKPLGIEAAIADVDLDVGNILIRRRLIVRCDRVSKTPRPGKTKLSKWPARIEIYPVSYDRSILKFVIKHRTVNNYCLYVYMFTVYTVYTVYFVKYASLS